MVFPVGRQLLRESVIPGYSVDSALDQDQSELGVLVLPIPLQVLTNRDGLLDQMEQVFRDLRSQSVLLENSEDLRPSDVLDLRYSMSISE